MKKLSLQGFYDFVAAQLVDKEINNRAGWDKCAVGDYVNYVQGTIGGWRDNRAYDWVKNRNNSSALPDWLRKELVFPEGSQVNLSTYGALNKFIMKNK